MTSRLENDIIIKKKMYYDEYEKIYGDGFYPKLTPRGIGICTCKNTTISFKLIVYKSNQECAWIQIDNSVIYGFDGNNGIKLLHSLNKEANVQASSIFNCGGRIIYPVIPYLSTYRAISQNMTY